MVDLKNLIRSILREELQEAKVEKQKEDPSLKQQTKELVLKAQEEALKIKQEAEREVRKTMQESLDIERRLATREEQLEEKERQIGSEKAFVEKQKQSLEQLKKEYEEKREIILQKLEKVAQMTKDQAKQLLISGWEEKLKTEIAKKIKQKDEEIKQKVDEKAKEILIDAMRYGATDYVAEYTLSVINLPNEDFKGRIIGKDGRNIRAFELATGVDVDLEEEGVIRLSSFDAIKREVARQSLERLIKDGRIQPERIEEIVKKTKQEVDKIISRAGEELAHNVGVFNLPQEIVHLLGKFKYRYSYGQNMILHTLEETRIGVSLAHELKVDVNTVKLGCLLHDIGKVITEKEGSHVELGVELLKKYRFPQKIIDCVAAHHEDIPFTSVESVIVYISDAVSGGRPGARHEDFEQYLKRIKTIEDTAKSKKGVKETYALQAGRELRVIVKPEEVSDEEATILSEKIREELEKKFDIFPGQIKVTVIREYRAEATTKI
ncbi:ribonuclease Y [Candidatus Roizmanbacteria bacterium RIFCSPHIGHO2_02_FULL_37_15]|uniref:Ribonuclease Y n=1 Tax=Candidatus Roizmanbacteria bacterium RIFCSPLOWO2_01_FULL_37_16 TaxID=1802058 RepID=A0A1F7ING4_9BACT|nr:MAG: ribonuclease Y [Candidatus Roizmanbacteria bacterium RIFCSPHIGHO2_01_FULL_37_16b]OGK22769.1 MAG: ribonuclease Y [Candidatus Roizmanbacteria bacterium RIFCSPHIGHO2_02_FULL_37_15]OGK33501.1 MAG: ribonuclease Y [Candidatus Roizmanbacteria bacterium RIFCSPHIGHO2_12_FULL_36_11]OGK44909.1 MAG: ribonuclease Y [Candidatus Roizmanbacteria bacterium RIFCSPLOWO2_01_FULL_37_16]OGK57629.1 MAG: ribonuclease Y [Candidatus Roizmanbacteria bacterium RIFCSPLOWO2_02_FULL_37_9]